MTNPPTIEERIANLEGSFAQIANRLDRVGQDVRGLRTEMNGRFDRLDQQYDRVNQRIDRATQRIDDVERRIDLVGQRIDRLIYWQLGLIGAVAASIAVNLLTRFL